MVRENRAVSGDKIINRKTNQKQVTHEVLGRMSKFNRKPNHPSSARSILDNAAPGIEANYKKFFTFKDPSNLAELNRNQVEPKLNAKLTKKRIKIHSIDPLKDVIISQNAIDVNKNEKITVRGITRGDYKGFLVVNIEGNRVYFGKLPGTKEYGFFSFLSPITPDDDKLRIAIRDLETNATTLDPAIISALKRDRTLEKSRGELQAQERLRQAEIKLYGKWLVDDPETRGPEPTRPKDDPEVGPDLKKKVDKFLKENPHLGY